MTSTIKVAVGKGGMNLLGEGRARLLELLVEKRSLRKAAYEMGMSYRHAWGTIKRLEEGMGVKLVLSKRGGLGGGTSDLTEEGTSLLREYRNTIGSARSATAGELVRARILLLAQDANGHFATLDGKLPSKILTSGSTPKTVLCGIIDQLGPKGIVPSGPTAIMEDGELLLVFTAAIKSGVPGSRPPAELDDKDVRTLRLVDQDILTSRRCGTSVR